MEDDDKIRIVLSAALEDEGYVVVEAETGEIGVDLVDQHPIDLAIVDLRLPGMNGFEVVRELRKKSTIPIVIFTAHGDSHDVVAGLEAGADDFLTKPIGSKELAARLRAILRRAHTSIESEGSRDLTVGEVRLRPGTHESFVGDVALALTRTEFEVIVQLATRSPETLSRADLLDRVWGYDYLGDTRLVDMQIYRLRGKLAVHGLQDKIVTVRGVGFKLLP
ncbi:MAG: response regulator transcription factor [Ilumatobacteraceae bacterium]